MTNQMTTIERAFEIARTGKCINWSEVVRQLKSERFEGVEAHFSSPSLRKQITAECDAARTRVAG
jgi:hypothetical protein